MARFSEKHEKELKELVEQGMTLPEIAKHFKVSYATASNGLKELGLKAKRSPWGTKTVKAKEAHPGPATKISKDELVRMYVDEDMTVGEIAEACGVTRQTVYNTMERYGVPRQKKSRIARMFDEQQVRNLMDRNMTTTEVAEKLNVSPSTLRSYIKEKNIKTRNERYAEVLTKENLQKWYIDDNQSLMEIAKKLGCNYNTVSHACKKFGLVKTREQIHDTMVATMRSRYGVSYAMENPEIQAKMRYSRSPEFAEKVKECKKVAPKMIAKGATISDIAKRLDCSYKKTREMLIELGLFTPSEENGRRNRISDMRNIQDGEIQSEA